MNDRVLDLRRRIANRDAVIVVGAGVSLSATAGRPEVGWVGLLTAGIVRAHMVDESLPASWAGECLRELRLGTDSMIAVADKVTQALGGMEGAAFAHWLRDTFEHLDAVDASVLEALVALRVPLLTTNYDSLLEKAADQPAVTWRDPDGVRRVLRREDRSIVHLHGHWKDPRSVILGRRSYDELMAHDPAQTLQKAAATLRSLVFVGMGAGSKDPNFVSLCQWLTSAFVTDEYPHFRLCLASEVPEFEKLHRGEGILPVPYGTTHDDLETFLHNLLPQHVLPTWSSEQESGVLFVPDGNTWTKVHHLMNLRTDLTRKPFVQRYPETALQSFESLLQACLLGSAVGYHPGMADIDNELHPLNELRSHKFDGMVPLVPIEFPEFDIEVVAESHAAEIERRVRVLHLGDPVSEYFKELVERDAFRFFGTDESLDEPSLPYSEYRFGKSYVVEQERLCRAVDDRFAHGLAQLVKPVKATASERSRDAFVRRVIVSHLAIGYSYLGEVTVGVPLADDRQLMTSVMHTPSRAPGALGWAVVGTQDAHAELVSRLLPFATVHLARCVLDRRLGEPEDVFTAMHHLRGARWANAARRVLGAMNEGAERASVEKAMRDLERALQDSLSRRWLQQLSMPRPAIGHRAVEDLVIATNVGQLLEHDLRLRFREWLGMDS